MVRTVAITLLRHGLTEDNLEKRYMGWSDSPLSSKGREQLNQLKSYPYPSADYILSSDLRRCSETYEILFDSNQRIPYEFSTYWRETNFGDWERKTHQELKEDIHYQSWLKDWKTALIPDGEDYSTFCNRVKLGWEQATKLLLAESVNHIVIITHGGPIRKVLTEFAPFNKEFWEWDVKHGEGFTLETTSERIGRNERCISLLEVPFKESVNG